MIDTVILILIMQLHSIINSLHSFMYLLFTPSFFWDDKYMTAKNISSLNLVETNYMFQIIIYQVIKSTYTYIIVFVLIKAKLEFALYKKNAPMSKLHILK